MKLTRKQSRCHIVFQISCPMAHTGRSTHAYASTEILLYSRSRLLSYSMQAPSMVLNGILYNAGLTNCIAETTGKIMFFSYTL